MTEGTGVTVIGAGMAGHSHAHAYRTGAPGVRPVAIADLNSEFAAQHAVIEAATTGPTAEVTL